MYVELKGVTKDYGSVTAVSNVNMGANQGKLVAILGPSGSGKTTILRMIAGLEMPTAGDIYINGKRVNDLHPKDRGVGFVFQSYALFRYMTVEDNIAFGLDVKKMPKKEIKEKVNQLLELVDLKDCAKRFPNELSGGQRQRVAFARALATDPALLLLDEPFAAIDAKVRKELRTWLRSMIHKVGITSIFVTHDQDEAVEVADEIIVMSKGKIEQIGTPKEIYRKPESPFVSQFIGQGSIIKDITGLTGFTEYTGNYLGAVIRPEFVEAFKPDNLDFKEMMECTMEGIITDISFMGSALEVTINAGGYELKTRRSPERRAIAVGEKMRVLVYRVFAFDETKVYLLKNSKIKKQTVNSKQYETYLYRADGYYAG